MGEYAGSVLWAKGKHFVTYNGTITRPKRNNIDDKFGYYMLYRKELNKICGGSGLPFLSYQELNKVEVNYSKDRDEQIKISKLLTDLDNLITLHQRKYICFFYSWEQRKLEDITQIDNLITLHQRKCDTLVNVKKSLLEKLFPKNSSNIPEIRFKGFTDVWEQRKLGEIINETIDNRGKNPPYYCESGIPIIDNFMIKNNGYPDLKIATRYLDDYLFSNFIRKYNEKDDVLITLVGNGIGNIALFPKEKSAIVQNTIGMRFEHPKKFKYYSLLSKNNEIVKLDRGMAQPSIRQDELKNLDINLPTEKEQSKIESLMTNLDNLITLHQRKLEKLNNIKKSMLDKMFV